LALLGNFFKSKEHFMNTQANNAPRLNGQIQVGNDVFRLAGEKDFSDLLVSTSRNTQLRVLTSLKDICAGFGEERSATKDLYRMRLKQLRTHANKSTAHLNS
jgi:hypothetical protein